MFTVLWDNDGVLVDTEGMYFQACQEVLGRVGIDLTLERFKEISLRRGESTFTLAIERGVTADDVESLRKERDRLYAELLQARSCVIDGAEEVLRFLHGRVRAAPEDGAEAPNDSPVYAGPPHGIAGANRRRLRNDPVVAFDHC